MKRKKLMFLFTFLVLFLCVSSVNAYTCEYGPEYGGTGDFSAKFNISSSSSSPQVTYDLDKGSSDVIENWRDSIGSDQINGLLFQAANKCPEYIIYIKRYAGIETANYCIGVPTQRIYVSGVLSTTDASGNLVEKDYLQNTKDAIWNQVCVTDHAIAYLVKQPDKENPIVKTPTSCTQFSKSPTKSSSECANSTEAGCYSCENNPYFACIWNETKNGNGYCNVDNLQYIRCGDAFDVPNEVPTLLSMAVNLLKIAVPIILIVVSVITLLKALAASKEDEIKKAQSSLVKKLIISVLIFFVISIVQFVILKVADDGEVGNLSDCLSCLLNNDCQDSLYYKNIENGISRCYYVNGGEFSCFEEN